MENENEKTTVIGYKGFDRDWKCRGFQYEVGKEYETEEARLCKKGFHFCENPHDVFTYYAPGESRFAIVEAQNVTDEKESDSKRVSKKIRIKAEISVSQLCKMAVSVFFERFGFKKKIESADANNAGNYGAANAGDYGAANAGDYGAANAGNYGAANAGNYGAANAGNYGAANAGYKGAANAGDYGAANAGNYGAANAGDSMLATTVQPMRATTVQPMLATTVWQSYLTAAKSKAGSAVYLLYATSSGTVTITDTKSQTGLAESLTA